MKYHNFDPDHAEAHASRGNRPPKVHGDAIVVFEDEMLDLPRRCIKCCGDMSLYRREQLVHAQHQNRKKATAHITYSLCQEHGKNPEKNGFLVAGWLGLSYMLLRVGPIGIVFAAIAMMGIGVFLILRKTLFELKVKKFEQGRFWITGFSREFLDDLSSNVYVG